MTLQYAIWRRAGGRLSCLCLGLIMLAGCTLPSDDWRVVETDRESRTEWQVDRAYIRFLDRSIEPIRGDLSRLTRFLLDRDVKETDRIQVAGSGAQDPLGFEAERIRVVAAHLRDIGYAPKVLPPVRRATVNPLGVDSVRVTVGRFVALGPDCPDWTNPSSAGAKNLPASNHGCADAANLAVMIDQPQDLVRGRGAGSRVTGDSAVLTARPDIKAVETYSDSGAPGSTILGAPTSSGTEPQGIAAGNVPSASGSGTLP